MKDCSGAEEANAGHDLRGDARRVAIGASVGSKANPRDIDRQLCEQRRANADEDIRTQPGRLAGELALDTDRAAKQRGEQKLGEDAESQRFGECFERRGRNGGRGSLQENRTDPVRFRDNLRRSATSFQPSRSDLSEPATFPP
jgi:hypothetical protein